MSTTTRAPEALPLRHDTVARGWLALRALSDAGDQIWTIALAWTAVHVATPAAAGLVVAAGTVPRALVLLLGGVVADRYDARRVMILANGARIAVLVAVMTRVALGPPSLRGAPRRCRRVRARRRGLRAERIDDLPAAGAAG